MSRVVITAGASGIGRAMAEAFHGAGHDVWIMDVAAAGDVPWKASQVDVVDEARVAQVWAEIAKAWGGVDVVCANAGIAGPTALVEDVALADWRACVSVNLEGAFLAAKYAAPLMKEQGAGALVFTSSTAGIFGYPNRAPYAAAKWGLWKVRAWKGFWNAKRRPKG